VPEDCLYLVRDMCLCKGETMVMVTICPDVTLRACVCVCVCVVVQLSLAHSCTVDFPQYIYRVVIAAFK